jgi:hypothetical protein
MPAVLGMDGLTLDVDVQLGALQESRDPTDKQVDQSLAVLLVTEFGDPVMRVGPDRIHCGG